MRRLLPALVMSMGLLVLSGEAVEAGGLDRSICESLLYKTDPSDELYTIDVVGLYAPEPGKDPGPGIGIMGSEYVTVNTLQDPKDESFLSASIQDNHVLIEVRTQGETILVLDYQAREHELPHFYVNYIAHTIIGECVGQVDDPMRGEHIRSYALNYLWLYCNSPDPYMLLCSPFFLSRETALSTTMSYDQSYLDEIPASIMGGPKTGGQLRRIMSRILAYGTDLKNPCFVLSAYLGEIACRRLFDR